LVFLALFTHSVHKLIIQDVDILIFDRDRAICTLDLRAKLASSFPDEFEDVPEPVSSCLNIPDRVKVDFIPQESVSFMEN
jgi:hypothetical protein